MPTRYKNGERRLASAERMLERYRAAVEEMMTARFDLELTAAHLKRTALSRDQVNHCETIARELRWRLMPFCAIDPGYYEEVERRLKAEFERRDAFNMHQLERRSKASEE